MARTNPVTRAVKAAQRALERVDSERPSEALPHLREAAEQLTAAIDEAMAAALLEEGGTLRKVGTLAGLSENAVGPRLARTEELGAYSAEGRVTATGVTRALYDKELGRHQKQSPDASGQPPLKFRARRPSS